MRGPKIKGTYIAILIVGAIPRPPGLRSSELTGCVHLWEVDTYTERATLLPVIAAQVAATPASASGDGSIDLILPGGTIRVRGAVCPSGLDLLSMHRTPPLGIREISFPPDSGLI